MDEKRLIEIEGDLKADAKLPFVRLLQSYVRELAAEVRRLSVDPRTGSWTDDARHPVGPIGAKVTGLLRGGKPCPPEELRLVASYRLAPDSTLEDLAAPKQVEGMGPLGRTRGGDS